MPKKEHKIWYWVVPKSVWWSAWAYGVPTPFFCLLFSAFFFLPSFFWLLSLHCTTLHCCDCMAKFLCSQKTSLQLAHHSTLGEPTEGSDKLSSLIFVNIKISTDSCQFVTLWLEFTALKIGSFIENLCSKRGWDKGHKIYKNLSWFNIRYVSRISQDCPTQNNVL